MQKDSYYCTYGIVLNIHKVDRTMIKSILSPNKSNHLPWHQPSQSRWSWTLAEGLLQQSVQGLSSSHQSAFGHRPEWLWWVADTSPQSAEFLLVAGRLRAEATPCVRRSQTEGCLKPSSQCRTRPGKAISAGLSLHDRRQVYTTFSEFPAGISAECVTVVWKCIYKNFYMYGKTKKISASGAFFNFVILFQASMLSSTKFVLPQWAVAHIYLHISCCYIWQPDQRLHMKDSLLPW